MENWIVAVWVLLFVAIPVVALVLARRQRMKRHAASPAPGTVEPHRPHGHHREGR